MKLLAVEERQEIWQKGDRIYSINHPFENSQFQIYDVTMGIKQAKKVASAETLNQAVYVLENEVKNG